MLPSFATQTVIRVRPAIVTDGHNNQVPDYGNVVLTNIPGCSVQPGVTDELLDHRDTTLIQWTVYAPSSSADIQQFDRIRHLGIDYDVDGEQASWVSPTGFLDHKVLLLKRWNG